uniref:Uncharacterized protein n=1 Tax=Anguilla anguilla TaxID=7936 RepID=A0A0E9S8N7_ANGAN
MQVKYLAQGSSNFWISWKGNSKPSLIDQSAPSLTNALLAEWKQIPAAVF